MYGQTQSHGEAESSIPSTYLPQPNLLTKKFLSFRDQNFRYPACNSPAADRNLSHINSVYNYTSDFLLVQFINQSVSRINEDSSSLERYCLSLGKVSGVQTILVPSSSRSNNPKRVILFTLLDLEEEGTTITQNGEEVQPYDTAKFSTTTVRILSLVQSSVTKISIRANYSCL